MLKSGVAFAAGSLFAEVSAGRSGSRALPGKWFCVAALSFLPCPRPFHRSGVCLCRTALSAPWAPALTSLLRASGSRSPLPACSQGDTPAKRAPGVTSSECASRCVTCLPSWSAFKLRGDRDHVHLTRHRPLYRVCHRRPVNVDTEPTAPLHVLLLLFNTHVP